jgi:tetratricopeptide (TPR) repeat protein
MLVPSSSTLATGGYWPGLAGWVYVALPELLLAAAPTLARMNRRIAQLGTITFALLLAWQTQHAIAVWRSNETLLQDMIAKYPSDWYAYFVLSRYRLAEHDDAGAVALLRQGTQACGPHTKLSCIEGSTLARMGRCRESAVTFSSGPDCAALAGIDAWHALGVCYANQGDFANARRALSQCENARAACRTVLAQLPE